MIDQPTMDSRTTDIVRSAIAAAQAGRLADACAIGQRGLSDGGDPAVLHAMIGSFLGHLGDFSAAIPHLETAFQSRPDDHLIVRNLASALIASERYDDACALLTVRAVAIDDGAELQRLRGFAAQMIGDSVVAIETYEQVLRTDPDDWETWNNLGNTQVSAGDLTGGIAALQRAAGLNPQVAPTRLNLARALRDAGNLAEAEAQLRSMADDFPGDSKPLADLFGLLDGQGLSVEAQAALQRAIDRDPLDLELQVALGRHQLTNFAMEDAEQTFRRVISSEPANGEAFLGLADVLEHYRPQALGALLAEAEAAHVDTIRLNLIRAFIARRDKRYCDGLGALETVPEDFDPVQRWQLAGQLFDGAGEFDSAFDAFGRMNQALADDRTQPVRRAAELRERMQGWLGSTTLAWRENWVAPPTPTDVPAPIFLVGFPRSGTTLLDTMLMGHPAVEVMEERPILARIREELGDFDALAKLGQADVRRLQKRYYELARSYAELRPGSLLIDKSPLHMQNVPLIYRLFPDARFILALRHPADVVLSCFMAKFRLNSSMANFLRIDTAAEFYDLTFSMWEEALKLFPVEVHTVVYEKLIEDPEGQLKPVVEALGLEWRPDVLDHQKTAQTRGVITTASYAQVTQPLYRSAVGRWRHYRNHLEPILPTLRPWIERYGYDL